ncbi:unnamed protein product, partial [Linum tenue]
TAPRFSGDDDHFPTSPCLLFHFDSHSASGVKIAGYSN